MQVSISSFEQAVLLAMVLVGVQNEPQGPAYLPPSSRPAPGGGGGTGHPDDWAGVSMYYGLRVSTDRKKLLIIKTNRHDNVLSLEIYRVLILFFYFWNIIFMTLTRILIKLI